MQEEYVDVAWRERPDQIRKYYELRPLYERLCSEVALNLEHSMKREGLEYAQISSRVKTLNSFCEKVYRKSYQNPTIDITDLAGVRIVFLYELDIQYIKKIIEDNFEVIEMVDKASVQGVEIFGYRALHYVVKIKSTSFENRFSDLRNLVCEIQVRTTLQDAWALVAHHLSYKQESDIPKELRRKLNALSGLFEIADNQLQAIRGAREEYQSRLDFNGLKTDASYPNSEINFDNLNAYINWRFPDRPSSSQSILTLLDELHDLNYKSLVELDRIIDRTFDAVIEYEKASPPYDDHDEPTLYTGVGFVRSVLGMIHGDYYKEKHSEFLVNERLKYIHLIKP